MSTWTILTLAAIFFGPLDAQDYRTTSKPSNVYPAPTPAHRQAASLAVFPLSSTSGVARKPPNINAQEPVLTSEPPAGSLIARIHGNGLLGYVMFTPDATGSRRTVIKIRGRPTLGCSSLAIGPVLYDLSQAHGQVQVDKDIVISSPMIDPFGDKSLLGRTLVLHGSDSGAISCATIMPATRKKVYQAKLHHPVAGTVTVMQTSTATGILAEYMMYSNGTRKSSSHKWQLVEGTADDLTWESKYNLEKGKCATLRGGSLLPPTTAGAAISVSTEMPGVKGRSYQVVRNVKSIDSVPVTYLILFEDNDDATIMSCVALSPVTPKSARAKFGSESGADVQGYVSLTQESPFDPTAIEINLSMAKQAYSYGIDLLPTIRRRAKEPKACPNIKETIYNPFFKDPEEIPAEGLGTTDQYAVGDLSGKFGSLNNKQLETFTGFDFNLPLFGTFSVIGRALVLYAPDGPPIACANIELSGTNITTAYATFDVPLQGQFIFRQSAADCSSDTYVYIEVSKPDTEGASKSFNHPWHIHTEQVASPDPNLLSAVDCAPAGPHFNPYNVSTDCIYQRDCTLFTPLRCELGDTTGKLGPIDVPVYKNSPLNEPEVGKYYFVDTDQPLCGPTSSVGKSIVVHREDFGAPRLTCSNILEFKPRNQATPAPN
ncbi:hypothetical protein HDE_14499 [Halotydeus destructor]|nr:hypothetical protein HDE_14499 [Halotydeus destructor]